VEGDWYGKSVEVAKAGTDRTKYRENLMKPLTPKLESVRVETQPTEGEKVPTATMDKRSEMTAREYAASLGLAKMGRGRMSPLAKAAIAKAESEGVTFKLPAHVLAAQERETNGPKRVRKAHTPKAETGRVVREGKLTDKVVTSDYDGKPVHPSEDWYRKTFYVGAYVSNPEGMTLFCVTNEPDSEGFTHFVDKHAKKWKAKVNASWGTRKGWPQGGTSIDN
jgi:hypothetical protein